MRCEPSPTRSRTRGQRTPTGPMPVMISRSGKWPWRTSRLRPSSVVSSEYLLSKVATSASTACASSARAPLQLAKSAQKIHTDLAVEEGYVKAADKSIGRGNGLLQNRTLTRKQRAKIEQQLERDQQFLERCSGHVQCVEAPDWAKGGGEAWSPDYWACEIHQIVAGAQKHDLERVFSIPVRSVSPICGSDVEPVQNLGKVISAVFRCDLQTAHPWVDDGEPTKRDRRDFYTWLLSLRPEHA
jgi:hypothetical protein